MLRNMAGTTGLEPAASAVTGQRSNQLNYVPTRQINKMRNYQCLCGFARLAYRAPVAPDCPKERDSCPNRPQTAYKSWPLPAPVPCANPLAQTTPGDPDCSRPGRNRQRNLSKCLAQKYPNSFSQNTKVQDELVAPLGMPRLDQKYEDSEGDQAHSLIFPTSQISTATDWHLAESSSEGTAQPPTRNSCLATLFLQGMLAVCGIAFRVRKYRSPLFSQSLIIDNSDIGHCRIKATPACTTIARPDTFPSILVPSSPVSGQTNIQRPLRSTSMCGTPLRAPTSETEISGTAIARSGSISNTLVGGARPSREHGRGPKELSWKSRSNRFRNNTGFRPPTGKKRSRP